MTIGSDHQYGTMRCRELRLPAQSRQYPGAVLITAAFGATFRRDACVRSDQLITEGVRPVGESLGGLRILARRFS